MTRVEDAHGRRLLELQTLEKLVLFDLQVLWRRLMLGYGIWDLSGA